MTEKIRVELIDLSSWGLRLYRCNEDITESVPSYFELESDDMVAPATRITTYETLDEAIGDMVNYIQDPNNVYAMEDQPGDLQEAYEELGVPCGVNPNKKEIAAGTFLYYVLYAIACEK